MEQIAFRTGSRRAAFLAVVATLSFLGPAAAQPAPDAAVAAGRAATAPTLPAPAERPDFGIVARAVEKSFTSLPDYQAGDLIRQSQVQQCFDLILEAGWDVPARDALLGRVLADDSFLVKELSSPTGRKFMRRVARHPGTYSRLDRLSTISGGERLIHDMIRQKDGDKLIEYLATTRGGRNMGRMMAGARQGVDLNKPTGRIYTADELVAALKGVYLKSK
jgi:hypothetical protein